MYVRTWGVYNYSTVRAAWDATGKAPIEVKWVDIDKGDPVHPGHRSRIVALEIKANDVSRDDLFAASPPMGAKKMLLSLAMTEGFGYS